MNKGKWGIIYPIGTKFGDWTILDGPIWTGTRKKYSVRCDCGNIDTIEQTSLSIGYSTRCRACANRASGINRRISIKDRTINYVYTDYRKSSKRRSLSFSLSKEEFEKLIFSNCSYCGVEPSNCPGRVEQGRLLRYNGIDRIDNSVGYVNFNVTTCCWFCNQAKRAIGNGEWSEWLKRIAKVNGQSLCSHVRASPERH